MSVNHAVGGVTGSVLGRNDLPVTVLLNHLTDVADRCTEVLDPETGASLRSGEALTARKEVDHLTSLGQCIGHNNNPSDIDKEEKRKDPMSDDLNRSR